MKYVTPFKNVICNIFYNQCFTALEFILQNVPKELENLWSGFHCCIAFDWYNLTLTNLVKVEKSVA